MIREVHAPPLEFERIVVAAVSAPLAEHGFRFTEPFHLYKNELVPFTRERRGFEETIEFCRRIYRPDEVEAGEFSDEADRFRRADPQDVFWVSRHLVGVQLLSDKYGRGDLLTTGRTGWSATGEDWWRFTDEADLRRVLRDEVLPLLVSVALPYFDEALEELPARRAWRERQNEEVRKAVAALPEGYSEAAYKAACLAALAKFAPQDEDSDM